MQADIQYNSSRLGLIEHLQKTQYHCSSGDIRCQRALNDPSSSNNLKLNGGCQNGTAKYTHAHTHTQMYSLWSFQGGDRCIASPSGHGI